MTTPSSPRRRSVVRAVAMPVEHGGWGLTAEPVLAGLAVAPSLAGVCLGVSALLVFLARTPLRVVLVDRHRGRQLERTGLAWRVLVAECLVILALVVMAAAAAESPFWWPLAVAVPLALVELWFDTRSRSRRTAPELAGAVGICSVAAMVILSAGGPAGEAVAVWLVLAGRNLTSIPHVRAQIARLHGHGASAWRLIVADGSALAVVAIAAAIEPAVVAGAVAVAGGVVLHWLTARAAVPAKVVGVRETVLGLVVVIATATGIHLA